MKPTKPGNITRDGVTYEPRLVLQHGDGSISARYHRTTPAPAPRRGCLSKILSCFFL